MNKNTIMVSDTSHYTPAPEKKESSLDYRKLMLSIQKNMESNPEVLLNDSFPLEHSFAEGLYIKTFCIPKGFYVLGKLHKESYCYTLLSGIISMLTEDGYQLMFAPQTGVAPPLTQRFAYAHTNVVFMGVFPNPDNCTDIEVLDKMIHITPDLSAIDLDDVEKYKEQFDRFLLTTKETDLRMENEK